MNGHDRTSMTAVALAAAFAFIACPGFPKDNAVVIGAREPRAISETALSQLRKIAARHPCAALGTFQLLQDRGSIHDDAIFLDFIPAGAIVSQSFENMDSESAAELSMYLRQSLYSQVEHVVQIRWIIAKENPQRVVVTFRAELLKDGEPMEPRHFLEPDIRVLVNDRGVWLLDGPGSSA